MEGLSRPVGKAAAPEVDGEDMKVKRELLEVTAPLRCAAIVSVGEHNRRSLDLAEAALDVVQPALEALSGGGMREAC